MKKLVFCILCIIVIVGSFVIPCFALNFQYHVVNDVSYQDSDQSAFVDGMTVSYYTSDHTFEFSGTSTFSGGITHYTFLFNNTNRIRLNSSHTYFCYFGTNTYPQPCLRNPSNEYIYLTNDFITIPSSDYYTYGFRVRLNDEYSGRFPFVLIDMDIMYPEGHPDYDQVLSDLNSLNYFSRIERDAYYQVPGFFEPLTDFYLSFFHLFDWLPEIVSTYSAPFVFGVICLSVLLIVFIIVSIIRRCRS